MSTIVDVVSRKNAVKQTVVNNGSSTLVVYEPSVVQVHASPGAVARYVREGNDLLIYMQDGTVIRCDDYFVEAPETGEHSELVFEDGQTLTHVTFADSGAVAATTAAPVELVPQVVPIESIEPFIGHVVESGIAPWVWGVGAALGGGALGFLLADNGDSHSSTQVVEPPPAEQPSPPTFLVTDTVGGSQGVLSSGALTDDTTPTFSGTGEPGASIQIKDSNGNTIASTMVGDDGIWTVKLPTQADGEHTWSVVQINGSETTPAGEITLTVDSAAASISLATTAGDNIVNAIEQGAGFTLSGGTRNLEPGTSLTVSLNGKSYTTEVDENGNWRVNVPAADAKALADGNWVVTVTGEDATGNTITGPTPIGRPAFAVDTTPPTISVDTIAQDNIINAAEHNRSLVLSGKTDAEAGQVVTLHLNGKTYTATVGSDGNWQVNLNASDVRALTDGDKTLSVSVSDKAGNSSSANAAFRVDATVPVVTVNTVAGDDVINNNEQTVAQIISGQATGAASGDTVTVTLEGNTYTTVVQADGSWSVGVPPATLGALSAGGHTISVTVTDAAGNNGSATHNFTVVTVAPQLTIDAISQDNVLNAQESLQPLTLSGTTNLADGSTVTVTLNNISYSATVANGLWSVQVPVSDVLNLANTTYIVSATGADGSGNSGSAQANLVVDTLLPQVTINSFAGDDQVNNAEAGVDQTLSGSVNGAVAGDIVTVTLGGKSYTATVASDQTWSLTIPASDLGTFGDGPLNITASVTNSHGNTGSAQRDITIDTGLPGLRIDTISGDDVVNIIERQQDLAVTGSSSNLPSGTVVTITINGMDYQAVTDASGNWQIGIPAVDLQNWPAGEITVTASAQDAAGNPASIDHPIMLDLNPVAVTINTVAGDDILNAAEKSTALTLSGQTQNVEAGQTVVIQFADQTFTAQVQANGSWSLSVPATAMDSLLDGRESVVVSVTNVAGNSAQSQRDVIIDSQVPLLTINDLTTDNIIDATEAQQDLTITGTSDAEPGQIVTVTLNGKNYQATIQADGSWSATVPAADVGALTNGSLTVGASVSDSAGNTSNTTHTAIVDKGAPVVTIDIIAGDDVINSSEHTQAQIISGSVTGAAAGDTVTITINNVNYSTIVDGSGNWSLGLPASVVSALADATYTVSVAVIDSAGNSGSATRDVTVNTAAPTVDIDTIAGDDIINAAEKGQALVISGTSNQPSGTLITVTLNGASYTATTDASGNWSVTVPDTAVGALGESLYTVTATVTDTVGNSGSASHTVQVDSMLPGVTISVIAGDDIINAAEVAADQTISGTVTNAAAGDTVTVTVGGNSYTATVQADLSWSVTVPSADLTALGNGDLTVSASVTNAQGNSGSGTRDVTIDASLPGLRVDTVAGDDVVNSIEHGQALVITGSSTGLSAGATLAVVINGVTYQASVAADGSWSVGVPAADVSAWPAGTVAIDVSGSSSAGNPVSISHNVTVDLAAVAISIDTVAGDDVINAAEKGADLVLSGTTSGVEAGQTVNITFGGRSYTATVAADGSWSHTVPAADVATLRDGDASVQASVSNVNGNQASTGHQYSVDGTTPVISIAILSTDNVINAAEIQQDLLVSGTTNGVEAGQTVTVTLDGTDYTTTVQADGSWSVTVPAADLAGLTSGSYTVTAVVSDKAGNPATSDRSVEVDVSVPQLVINTVSSDDIINSTEHGQALVISGSSTDAAAGDVVTVSINNITYSAVVDASGNWSVGVPAADVGALVSGPYTITATLTDRAGNSGSASHDISVVLAAPVLDIDTIAGDDIINAAEKGQALVISGTSNQPSGTLVTVTLNGASYTATTDASGNWSVTVPDTAVGALGEAFYTVSATVTDTVGNSGSASHTVQVDSMLPGVTISVIAGDDIINAAEVAADQTISGTVTNAAAGDTVTVTLGGNSYTATVQADLSWSVTVPSADLTALGNGDLTVNATVTNAQGNSGSGTRDVTIDANLPGLRVDTVAGDDVVNSIEHGQALVITGSSTGLSAGATLVVMINGVAYQASVAADGSWSVGVPAADVSNWPAGTVAIDVSGSSSAGNPVSISHNVTVDLAAVAISIDTVAGDDVINAAEKGADLVLSGTTSGVEAGQTVNITFGGRSYTATVAADGSWSYTVPAADVATLRDGDASVQASVSNVNGNHASTGHQYSVDGTTPVISIGILSTDNVINAAEIQQDLLVNGTTNGVEAGQTVTVTLDGTDYTTTVQADGSWSVTVPAADLAGLTSGSYTVTAVVSDKAGNPATSDRSVEVDVSVPQLVINTVSSDDIINSTEHGQALVISGSSTDAAAGDVVTVSINNITYSAVVDASGNWSVGVPAADVGALVSGPYTITATLTDRAGNSGSASHDISVVLAAPVLDINTIAGDDIINAAEKGQDLVISGTSNQPSGTLVTVTLNGLDYTATTDASGNWSATVPASAVGGLGEAIYTVTAIVTDIAGNSGNATRGVNVESQLPGVTINVIAGDDIINAAEVAADQTISGTVTNAAAGDTVTVTLGGNSYTTTVQANLSWSVTVPSADLTALGNGDLTVSASVTNAQGNSSSGTRDVTIDANLPGLRIDTVAGDDVVNSIEHGQALVITGSSSGLNIGTQLAVLINGVAYVATVAAGGSWSVGIPAADVSAWPEGTLSIGVVGSSSAGNPVSISHNVTVDLAAVGISINTVAGDNVINAAEKGADLVLSGTTSGVEAGQTVNITFGGRSYTATVAADGSWSHTVPAADVATLRDGDASVQASVTNIAGNSASGTHAYSVDAVAPTVIINTLATDDILNASEAQADLLVNGITTAEAGQTVTVTLNGTDYTTTVQADGSWSVTVPAADLAGLSNGNVTVSATVSDKAGNPASVDHNLTVDLTVPVVTISTVAGDDVINLTEHGQAQIISGTATGAVTGDTVTVTIGGNSYTTVLDASGKWSVGVPASDISALQDGTVTISASVTDTAGNTGSATRDVTVDTGLPALGINTIAGDNILNAVEKGQDLIISGTSSNLATGTPVTVTLNELDYNATTDANGNWTLTVPVSDLAGLGAANYTVTASATSPAGNSVNAQANLLVNAALPGVTISIIAGDDIINATEVAADQTISGTVTNAAAGDTVTVTLGGNSYTTTVQANLSWSVTVPSADLTALGNGDLTVSATVTNAQGNSGSGTRDVTIDASLPGLRVDTVAGDDVVNSIEHGQALVITGSSSGLSAGTPLLVVINGVAYATSVAAGGSWSVGVPAADVSNWPAGTVAIDVSGSSSAGNPVSISHNVTVDLAAVAISIDTVAGDDVINAAEKGADLVLSGTTSGVEAGQTVNITFGGRSYTATVAADGSWSHTVPAADVAMLRDGDASVQVSVTNVAGNSASAAHTYSVDTVAPIITISTLAADDILSASEAQADLLVSGTTNGVEAGQTVTVTLNGTDYTTTVQADGSWSVTVPAADLAGLSSGNVTVSATVSDKAGNPASVDHNLTVDLTVPVVTISTVAGDDVINLTEHGQAQIISGTATGAVTGDTVTVTIGGNSYTTVLDASGKWSVGVPASDISALQDGTVTISASVTDAAGNTGSATRDVTVDTGLPALGINTIAGDNILNAVEKTQDLIISGTSSNLATGTTVTVTLNGINYSATTDASGDWTLTVPVSDLAGLGAANYTVTASATNSAGNSASIGASLLVDTGLPGVTINAIAGDDIINAAEVAAGQTISGTVINAAAGDTVTVTLGGNSYTATVQADLSWSVTVPSADLTALGNGDLTVNASVTNAQGNSGSGTRDVTIDASLPGLRVDTVAGDDVVNSIEHGQALVITGSSTGLSAGATLAVVINGVTYQASVAADGSWSVGVPAADVSGWPAGTVAIDVSGSSSAGNPVSISHNVTVDLAAVAISIDTVAGDDVINAAEKGADLVLSGTTSGVEAGQTVNITFGGRSYTATVAADGSWSHTVPAADVATLRDGDASVQVSVTNVAGNSASAAHAYSVDATVPLIIIDTVAGDNTINSSEAASGVTVSGTSTVEPGQTITVTFNGVSYTALVQAGGSWSLTLPASDLTAMADNNYTLQASVSDAAGNPANATKSITLDISAPVIQFNAVAGDDVINNVEHAQAQIVSGTATGAQAGDRLVISLDGQQYATTVDANGNWSVGIPASVISGLQDGTVTFSASITDAAGNSSTTTHDVVVNTQPVSLTIDIISSDDIINAAEAGSDLTISGTSTQFAVGTTVTVTLNGNDYTTTIQGGGSWSATVPAADVATLANGQDYSVTATAQNSAGNNATAARTISVDLTAPVVSIDTLSGDDVLNAAEQQQPLTIQGSTSAEAGQTVTITLGSGTYTAIVAANGTWTVDVPAADLASLGEGAQTVTATVSDRAGNSGQATHTLSVDTSAPTITIATVAGDDIINSGEQQVGQTISGTATAGQGQIVTVTFGGHTYTAVVDSNGAWSVAVPARDFLGLSDGDYTITAAVADSAGNPTTANHVVTLSGDLPTITINTFASDDIVSAAEHSTPLVISGTTDAPVGQTVTITLNGKTYTTTVQNGGIWNYTVGSADVLALADGGSYVIAAQVSNAIGNTGSDNHTVTVDLTAPAMTISIDSLLNDTGLSNTDFNTSATQLVVNGSLGAQLSNNEKAQISVDGGVTWTDLVVNGTTWIYSDSRTLTDGNHIYMVRVIDNAGNVGATDNQVVVVDTTAPDANKTISIDAITTDSGASGTDFITNDTSITLNGQLGAVLSATEVAQISIDSGQTWVNVIISSDGLRWSYADGRTLTDGSYEYRVRVVDVAGNVGSFDTHTVVVDTTAPTQVVTFTSINDDTGRSASDFVTSDTTLTIHGELGSALAADETLQISIDNGVTWTPLTVSGNQWSYSDSRTLTDGSYDYQVRVIDVAGNVSQPVTQTVVVDTQLPVETAEIVAYTDDSGDRQGTFDSSFATDDTTPVITGTLDAPLASGEVLYLYRNGVRLGAVTMVDALNWTYADTGLVDGVYTYTARVEDLAGNLNTSADFVLTVDTSVPTTLAPINNQITRDVTPIINGTVSAALVNGEYIEVTVNGVVYNSLPDGAVVVDPANNTWYLQIPDADAFAASTTPYTVTTQVKNSAGNGANGGISTGDVTINPEIDYSPTWTTGSDPTAYSATMALDHNGMWMVVTNQSVMQSTDPLTWTNTPLTLVVSSQRYVSSSLADWNRNGTLDMLMARNDYGDNYIVGYTNNGDGSWSSAFEVNTSTLLWYSSIIAFDREGDGYLDFLVTDAGGPDSNTFLWNSAGTLTAATTTANAGGSATAGGVVAGYWSLIEASGVDLNNDGRIDLAQHTYNLNNNYTLSTLLNQGDGSFVWGQNTINTFYGSTGSGSAANAVSMTWADFNGDGFMDLYLPAMNSQPGYGSLLTNDGTGNLSSPVAIGNTGTTYDGFYSVATDWNHDGMMDIVRIANSGQSYMYTNQGNGSSWVQSAFGSAMSGRTSGIAAMDYDWDGAVDVLVTKQTGTSYLIRNTNTVDYGTALHLRILDQNGINAYYGNTIRLYDSSGTLVASQIINPQAGMGVNDASALVSFYGLLATETYHVELVRSVGTVSSNIDETVNTSWGGLQATDATHAYVLSGEADSAINDGNFVGTGYNDTFFATAGTDVYNGAGGWSYLSGYGSWSANGGMDVVDFRKATSGITASLANSGAQDTGYNTSTFTNIEGITGSDFADTLTGSAADNVLEGRGGNDTLNIGNGGHDTLLFKLLNNADATGGNGSDVVNGFTIGTWEGTADTDRIDLRELFSGSGYSGNASAHYVNGVATLDAGAGNITSYINVIQNGSNSEVQIDRDGSAGTFTPTVVITINGVQTDLATLLANHQLMVV
ncbi:Ig-like domain-containing protein [Salmonella enterica]